MISMLYLELMLLRMQKILAIVMLLIPIVALVFSVVRAVLEPGADTFFVRLLPLLFAWLSMGSTIISMKRYRRFEALFSLSVNPKDILIGNLLMLGIYCIYIFLVFLPIYLAGIASITELRMLFLLALLLIAARGLANYARLWLKRLHLIQWIEMPIFMVLIFSRHYILGIADQPYVWLVLPISLIAVAITYWMAAKLSKERIILSSE